MSAGSSQPSPLALWYHMQCLPLLHAALPSLFLPCSPVCPVPCVDGLTPTDRLCPSVRHSPTLSNSQPVF